LYHVHQVHKTILRLLLPHKGFEWWEALHNTSFQQNKNEDIYQMPYEDEYSQLTPYED